MKKHTKILSLLLAVIMILSAMPMTAGAEDTEYTEGYYTYKVENSEATITDIDSSISGNITIPSTLGGYPVTSIGEAAVSYCKSITSITVAENNEYYSNDEYGVLFNKDKTILIRYPAGNTRISYVIPDSVTTIAIGAFMYSTSLESITIPESVTNIDDMAFTLCTSIATIDIPNSVTNIGNQAFSYCYSLTSITIPDSITSFSDEVFLSCTSLTDITIPDSVTSFGFGVFAACYSITNITIPDSVTSMDGAIFNACTNLLNIAIPDGITYIGEWAFHNCLSLESISIPESVTLIDYGAFEFCESLTSITIPDSVTTIDTYAFYYCTSLESITIPASVTEISNWAFDECSSLKSIIILNPECEIYNSKYTIASNSTIYGYEGSTAQAYAEKYDREFIAIVDECEHEYSSEITTPATHLTDGVMTFTCECGDTYTEVIAKTTEHTYNAVVTAPTCQEGGYTTYTCECGDSYTTDYTETIDHADNDGDALCDMCKTELFTKEETVNCSCNCHSKNSFISFFWKILNFFQKLFGTNPVCECGMAHY